MSFTYQFSPLYAEMRRPIELMSCLAPLLDYEPEPYRGYLAIRPRRQQSVDSKSEEQKSDPKKWEVFLNVKHFAPEELEVKTVDNFVVVHGKHEMNCDEHGFVSREFTRKYAIPEDVEVDKIRSSMSKDGILCLRAPRKVTNPPSNERVIPITVVRQGDQQQQESQPTQKEEQEKPMES